MSNSNRQALKKSVMLAEMHDFQIYLVHAPMFDGLYMNVELRRYIQELNVSLKNFTANNERIHLLGLAPVTFTAAEMENADHLILNAAERFTKNVADDILDIERRESN